MSQKLSRFSLSVLILNILVILWGAFVRASGSGAGCGAHWPLCNGELFPQANKIQTIIEFSHRISSGLAFVIVIILFLWNKKLHSTSHPARKFASWSLIFMVVEALIGAALVLLKLVGDNDSSHRATVVGLHLVNSFCLLAALTLTWLCQNENNIFKTKNYKLYALMSLFIIVSCAGAITALGDTLFPSNSLQEGFIQDFSSSSHFLIRLRVWHPTLAIITSLLIWIYCSLEESSKSHKILKNLIVAQIIFGFLNLLLLAPIWAQLVHLLFACCCWVCLVASSLTKSYSRVGLWNFTLSLSQNRT